MVGLVESFIADAPPLLDDLSGAVARGESAAVPPLAYSLKGLASALGATGMTELAALEPKPGMEPTTAHLAAVLGTLEARPAKMVLRAGYQADRASQWLAQRTRINPVTLPFTVGGTEGAKDLFGLFDDTIQRLLKGAA